MITDKTLEEVYNEYDKLLWDLVYKKIKYFPKSSRYDIDDLHQVACIALIHAYKNFDPDRNVSFSTYLYKCVRSKIDRYITKNHSDFTVNCRFNINNIKLPSIVNLDDLILGADKETNNDQIVGLSDDYTNLEICDLIRSVVDDDKKFYIWCQHYIMDRTYIDIANEFNISKQCVHELCKRTNEIILKKLKRSDFYE